MSKVNPDASTPFAGLNLDNRDPRTIHDRDNFKVQISSNFKFLIFKTKFQRLLLPIFLPNLTRECTVLERFGGRPIKPLVSPVSGLIEFVQFSAFSPPASLASSTVAQHVTPFGVALQPSTPFVSNASRLKCV